MFPEYYQLLGLLPYESVPRASPQTGASDDHFWLVSPYIDVPLWLLFACGSIIFIYLCVRIHFRFDQWIRRNAEEQMSLQMSSLESHDQSEI